MLQMQMGMLCLDALRLAVLVPEVVDLQLAAIGDALQIGNVLDEDHRGHQGQQGGAQGSLVWNQ